MTVNDPTPKEIKYLNKWKDKPCSRIGRLEVTKMAIPPKLIYRFNTIPDKIVAAFPAGMKAYSIIYIEMPGTQNSQQHHQEKISKKNKFGGFTISDFKTYYKNTAIKAMWV